MQLVNTFGGSRFGMLTDKYGINWMLSSPPSKNPSNNLFRNAC